MTWKQIVAGTVSVALVVVTAPALAQQTAGAIAGRATDEAKKPYTDYAVQLRDVASGLVSSTLPLDQQGTFNFTGVAISRTYLVELVHIEKKKIVCTEGPYSLTPTTASKLDVNVNCGKAPAAFWLLAAGAGAATAIAVATRSTSK